MAHKNTTSSIFFFFDAGLTLIHPYPSIGYHYANVARQFGVTVDEDRLEEGFYTAWKTHNKGHHYTMGPPYGSTHQQALQFWTHIIEKTFLAAQTPLPAHPDFPRVLYDHFIQKECWQLAPGVTQVFDLLDHQGIPFGILSNWDLRLRDILNNLQIANRFNCILVSAEQGVEKPDPRFFQQAETQTAHLDKSHYILVGNDEINDGQGALKAGWDICLIKKTPPLHLPPEIKTAKTLTQALSHFLD